MDLHLQNKVIVVTGGARGIGEGITTVLANEGAIPVVVGRDEADNIAVLSKIGKGFHVVAELTNPAECRRAVEVILEKYGEIHGLVNNAGVNDSVNLEQGSYEAFMGSIH